MTIALPWPGRSGGAGSPRSATGDQPGATQSASDGAGSKPKPRESAASPASRSATRFGGGDQEAPYETVYVAGSEPEAYVVKGRLEAEDIPAVVLRGQLADQLWTPAVSLHGIEVQVPRSLADRARTVLDNG